MPWPVLVCHVSDSPRSAFEANGCFAILIVAAFLRHLFIFSRNCTCYINATSLQKNFFIANIRLRSEIPFFLRKNFPKKKYLFFMANNSDTASNARSPMTEVARLTARVAALEESTCVLTFQYLRLKSKRRRLKKSFNRLAGRFLRLKEKYTAVFAERDRLAGENS